MENLFTPNCIRTYSGIYIDVFDPKPEQITIEDIAHALSMQPRFGGHLPVFYSVAQHSVHCMEKVDSKDHLPALLHDASEAYLLDIPSPIKSRLPQYKEVEGKLMQVIAQRFDFKLPLSESVKNADREMLQIEWDGIMMQSYKIDCWVSDVAKHVFLGHFKRLTNY